MRQDFYIFRHGQTDYNLAHRWQGCGFDIPLNATGRQQALALVPQLRDKNMQIIYSSCLLRAKETADIIAAKLEIPRAFCADLREFDLGDSEGLLENEVKARDEEFYKKWMSLDKDYNNICFAGGETKLEVRNRMMHALEEISVTNPSIKVFGIATHEGSILQVLEFFNISLPVFPNTGVCHLSVENNHWQLIE